MFLNRTRTRKRLKLEIYFPIRLIANIHNWAELAAAIVALDIYIAVVTLKVCTKLQGGG